MTTRLMLGVTHSGPVSLDRHLATHGSLPEHGPELIAEVEQAGLVGRGGAGFPAAIKLATVAAGARPVLVVNGTEGEPMSAKDRTLLTRAPHLVLDGVETAARAVGARDAIVAAPSPAHPTLSAALAERERERERGPRSRRLRVTLAPSAAGYVAGEETAVLAHLEGRLPRPRVTPPLPAHEGYRRRPTLVQNVETVAHIGLIARHGGTWFREAGTSARPGTTLVTVSGAVAAPGVYEVPSGIPLTEVVGLAEGPSEPVRALLVGGYFGAWVEPDVPCLTLDDAALKPYGATVGAGVVVVLGTSSCAVAETARLTAYLAGESAGQCGPCLHGLVALAGVIGRFASGETEPGDGERLLRWTEMVRGRGACRHPDGVARMLSSALRLFRDELEEHARYGTCASCATPSTLVLPNTHRARAAA